MTSTVTDQKLSTIRRTYPSIPLVTGIPASASILEFGVPQGQLVPKGPQEGGKFLRIFSLHGYFASNTDGRLKVGAKNHETHVADISLSSPAVFPFPSFPKSLSIHTQNKDNKGIPTGTRPSSEAQRRRYSPRP